MSNVAELNGPGQPEPVTAEPRVTVSDQGRALGEPTRYAIFEHLRLACAPRSVSQLAQVFPLHPNAIRQHLGKLRDAGLVTEEPSTPRGRGRPALGYRLSAGAIERWDDAGPHEELALMLLDMVTTARPARAVGQDAGSRLAVTVSGQVADPLETLVGVARRLGFEPSAAGSVDGAQHLVLRRCPFAAGAERAPKVVCELHRGLAEGVCRAAGAKIRVTDLVVKPPREGGCLLVLESVRA